LAVKLVVFRKSRRGWYVFVDQDLFLLGFLFLLLLGALINPNHKSWAYLLAYYAVFFLTYFVVKVFLMSSLTLERALAYNTAGVLFVCFFVIFEFSIKLAFNVTISDYLPKEKVDSALATIAGYRVQRAYGLMPEPGILGLYLNTLGVLAAFWAVRSLPLIKLVVFLFVLSSAYIFAFSSGALVSLLTALTLVAVIHYRKFLSKPFFIIGGLFTIIIPLLMTHNLDSMLEDFSVFSKILMPNESASGETRFARWDVGLDITEDAGLLGKGVGYIASSPYAMGGFDNSWGSFNNWYLSVAIETGWLGFICMAGFLILILMRVFRLKTNARYWMMIPIISGALQFIGISTFFNPFLWVSIALVEVAIYEQRVWGGGIFRAQLPKYRKNKSWISHSRICRGSHIINSVPATAPSSPAQGEAPRRPRD